MLLKTKLYTPTPRKDALLRPRLVDLLQADLDKPLILVSAPAGYGKTTLLAQFAAAAPLPVAWYQLDASDNDPATLLEYLVACIASRCPEFGRTTTALLQSIQNIAAEWQHLLVVLINEVTEAVAQDILLILDDYHLINNPLIHAFIDSLLAQAPPPLHLLLSTRSDPLISLARLRARGQVGEVRAGDLRFTPEEAHSFLNQATHRNLPAERIQSLVEEAEGWPAALQLVLTSLAHSPPDSLEAFSEGFQGTHRHLCDYLGQEVLRAQPPEVRSFLLSSSILEQMSPELCDQLLDIEDSRQILETLEAKNLFIVPLDDRHEGYRYHHLFREFLQERLRRQNGDAVQALHRRAAAYFEAVGDMESAIHHSQATRADEKLAELIERAAPVYLERGRLRTVGRWLEALPGEVVAGRPWLTLYRGTILALWGQTQEARLFLSQARDAFAATGDEPGESRALNQLGRLALFEGHYQESLELNQEALRRMPWADHEGRAQALRDQCELWIYLGDLMHCIQAAEESLAHAQQLGDRGAPAERTIVLGAAYRIAGRLSEAMRTMQRGLNMLKTPDALGAHIAHSQLGMLHLERWELDRALEHFKQTLALSQKFQDSAFIVYAHACLGIIYTECSELDQAQSHFEASLAILKQTGMRNLLAEVAWNYLAEWHLRAGRYTQAEACSRQAIALRGDEAGGLAWGMGWMPLAKVYLATGQPDQAEQILLDVAAASERAGNLFVFIASAFHLSQLYLAAGREDKAGHYIARALSAAAPEGHRLTFLAPGERAVPVLVHALKYKRQPAFAQVLLRELGEAARPALSRLFAHPDPEVRRYAGELVPAESGQPLEVVTAAAQADVTQVTCFGEFQVRYGGQEVGEPGWLTSKAGHLFAYFITFRESSLPRDRVLEALWPETRPDRSCGAFHVALHKLRHMLRINGSEGKFVETRGGEYYLEKERFCIDADEFTSLYAWCSRHRHESMETCEECAARLQRVEALYRGDYLANLYDDWVFDEQRQLQEVYLNAVQVLAKYYAHQGEYEQALAYCRQMLAKDPLLEDVHRQMMRYYGQMGDRNGVMRQHRHLAQILADEMGIDPMPETEQLYQSLLGVHIS